MPIHLLALRSLWSRRYVAGLTMLSIALSATLLLGVQRLRSEVHEGFTRTVSGADLLVGPRTGPVNLLLYAIFHIGDPDRGVSRATYDAIAAKRSIAWTIPLSMGDTHRGFTVIGTDGSYFRHYRFGSNEPLRLAAGRAFAASDEVVIGSEVATRLGYGLGQRIVLSHGLAAVSFADHPAHPLRVVGILRPTGTPIDRTVHVTLDAISAMHLPPPSPFAGVDRAIDEARARSDPYSPYALTAFLVRLKSPQMIFTAQRAINGYKSEPLTAVIPAVALQQLWEVAGVAEKALLLVSALAVATGVLGMAVAMLAGMNERRREMAILRAVGARPGQIFALLMSEVTVLALGGLVCGMVLLNALILVLGARLADRYGIIVRPAVPDAQDMRLLLLVLGAAALGGLLPAIRAYRATLADGLTVRV
jgi:putative ABC transport system permease protein